MVDLRNYNLEGKSFKIKHENQPAIEYKIIKAYPHNVLCITEAAEGVYFRESFSAGDLITLGVINTPQRALYHKSEDGGRDGYRFYGRDLDVSY